MRTLPKSNLKDLLNQLAEQLNFSGISIVELKKPRSLDYYLEWLDKGYCADMGWLREHYDSKANPESLLPQAKSAIVVRKQYDPHPWPTSSPLRENKIAKYAKGLDYHYELKRELQLVIEKLIEEYPEDLFLPMTDSHPVLERDLAHRAGLGWIGKNSCSISRENGSFFLIGEIYTSISTENTPEPIKDFCGTCTKCIEACPTDALVEPRVLDSNKCISYWTIEAPGVPPENLRKNFNGWLFGCDICQDVCPWNLKLKPEVPPSNRELTLNELKWILNESGKSIKRSIERTPLSRASAKKMKRNAIIVAANIKAVELVDSLQAYLEHNELGELAKWSIDEIQS